VHDTFLVNYPVCDDLLIIIIKHNYLFLMSYLFLIMDQASPYQESDASKGAGNHSNALSEKSGSGCHSIEL
jgi:hypothetical protein